MKEWQMMQYYRHYLRVKKRIDENIFSKIYALTSWDLNGEVGDEVQFVESSKMELVGNHSTQLHQ